MKMFNFDFMKRYGGQPIETVNIMLRTQEEARNRCVNLFEGHGAAIGAAYVKLRENGGSKVLYTWPEDR